MARRQRFWRCRIVTALLPLLMAWAWLPGRSDLNCRAGETLVATPAVSNSSADAADAALKASSYLVEEAACPTYQQMAASVKPLDQISLSVLNGSGKTPEDCFAPMYSRSGESTDRVCRRDSNTNMVHWKPSGLCHQPLYYEDVTLERYGQTRCLQPLRSGINFLASTALLPYQIGLDPPCDCVYTLGYQRPGNTTPPLEQRLPFSLKGTLLEVGAVTGAVFLFP